MQILLSRWANEPVMCDSLPKIESTENILKILDLVYKSKKDLSDPDGFAIVEEGNFLNILFQLPSEWNPQKYERVMLTITLDEHENSKIFTPIIKRHLKPLLQDGTIYQALYKEGKPNHPTVGQELGRFHKILEGILKDLEKKDKKSQLGLANIILLGIQAVGKTSIIRHLIEGKFSETRPTLAPQMLKLFFEQMDFRVYDVGGQKALRKYWVSSLAKPHGVIYIIECTRSEELRMDSAIEFDRMMHHYFVDPKKLQMPKDIPGLILGNKQDLNPDMTTEQIIDDYNLDTYEINYHVGLCSALKGEGLIENFQWFSKQMKMRKF